MSWPGRVRNRVRVNMRVVALPLFVGLVLVTGIAPSAFGQQNNNWKPVEDAMGRPGTVMGEVLRFGMPRKDLHVMVRGTAVKAGLPACSE